MRFIPIAGFLLLVLLLVFLLLTKPPADSGAENHALPTLTLRALDGHAWDQEKLLGHVTVINFFASWCAPCEAEMPEMEALKKQFPNVQFAGIAWNDAPGAIHTFLAKNGNPFDTLWVDQNGEATIALGLKGIPETLIVDAEGNIRYRLGGPVTEELRAQMIDALLTQLLAEANHAP